MLTARTVVQLGLSLIGKFAASMAISGIYVYSLEMFPTDSRHGLLAICCLSGRIGLILAPYSPLLVSRLATYLDRSFKVVYQLAIALTQKRLRYTERLLDQTGVLCDVPTRQSAQPPRPSHVSAMSIKQSSVN